MSSFDVETIHQLREEGHTWAVIMEMYPGVPLGSLSGRLSEYRKRRKQQDTPDDSPEDPPTPDIIGVTADEAELDEAEVGDRALRASKTYMDRQARKEQQAVFFAHGPLCITHFADLHLGGRGVDYERLDRDLELIRETPGMYAGLAGDLLDNFIVGRLKLVRHGVSMSIKEEWVLVRYALRQLGPKILWSCGGIHDKWTSLLSGIDYFQEVMARIRPGILYDSDEINVTVHVGQAQFRHRIRHKWRGRSMYSPTHGIERAAKFDKGLHFDVGVGAHTHESGVGRFFNNGGQTGLAVLSGSYKRLDDFQRTEGFPKPNEVTAVPVILDQDGSMLAANSLEAAARYMKRMYRGNE